MNGEDVANTNEIDAFLASTPATPAGSLDVASPDEVSGWLDKTKREEEFGSPVQQAIAAAEGAASAATFGLSTGLETALGVSPESIQARREINPLAHTAGQVTGLVGSTLLAPGMGAAGLLERAGAAAAAKAFTGATTLSKVGSLTTKAAVENALFQSGDEVSKMFAKDPTQSVDTAIADVGLAAVLGGVGGTAIGTAGAAWNALSKTQTARVLKSIVDKANGVEGAIAPTVDDVASKLGIDIPPEVRSTLSSEPWFQQQAKILEQSDTTKSGLEFQKTMSKFRTDVSNKIAEVLGKTPDDIKNFSQAAHGREAIGTFQKEFKTIYEPIEREYDEITKNFRTIEIPKDADVAADILSQTGAKRINGPLSEAAEKIAAMADESGYNAQNIPQKAIVDAILDRLPKAKTAQDLSNLNTVVNNLTKGDSNLWDVGGKLREIILDTQQQVIGSAIEKKSPELFARYVAARDSYKNFARMMGEAAQTLSLGKPGGFADFMYRLSDKRSPEEFLRKLSPKGNAEILPFLAKNFPETLERIRENELFQTLKPAFQNVSEGQALSPKKLKSALEKLSPEQREFILPPGQREKIDAMNSLLEKYNSLPHNFSNTARTLDKLGEYVPSSAVAMATMIAGGHPALALIVGGLTKALSKDVPDATRLALLKFMGSPKPIEAGSFKAMVDYAEHVIKGEKLIGKSIKGVLQGGKTAFPQIIIKEKNKERLDKRLKEIQENPDLLYEVGGETAHYLPDEATALAQTASTATSYLNGLRPNLDKLGPLDGNYKASKTQEAVFSRALDIAEQPLIVLKDVKDGTISPQDIITLQTIYPALYQRLTQKFTDEIVNYTKDGDTIPYKTKLGLSMFLGQPLDSTMMASSIMAAQPKPQEPPGPPTAPPQRQKHSISQLGKTNKDYLLPVEARQMSRIKRA